MSSLVRYEAAIAALAECKAVDEVKSWADKAAAMQAYGRMAKDKTMEVDAAEIRIRAERRLGEMLAATKAEGGLNKEANLKRGPEVVSNDLGKPVATLADAGISKDLSSRAQKLAAVPEAEFEAEVGEWRERVSAEGARVSAKLQAAGERELKKRAGKKAQPEPVEENPDLGADPMQLLEDFRRDLEKAEGRVKDLEALMAADDQRKKLLDMQMELDQARRARDDAMATSARLQQQRDRYERLLSRCGKAVGQRDLDLVAPAVEAMARSVRKVAA